ncbi:MAG: 7-cyano-7-deazaguanine synthase [Candidatus Heimdallarchaeota archaeon LC_2]|nr:MAG: 7-cyano-7-deazaguanine synthase [Candidatus Heimdallarchaeota archaeon LC_2]
MTKKTIIAILSGGLDSTTMLWNLQNTGYLIKEIITFNYGQRHDKEIENAKLIVKEFNNSFYEVNHQIIDMTNIGKLIAKGSLTGGEDVPHETYDSESQRITIVPNRNMIFLSIAAGRAISIGSKYIGYAAHSSDYSVYPDCRPEFIELMNKALYQGNLWNPVELIAPFQFISKIDVVEIGLKLNVPFYLTWSCYEGENEPCLQCGTCLERTEAFINNKIKDPAISEEKWELAVNYFNKSADTKI